MSWRPLEDNRVGYVQGYSLNRKVGTLVIYFFMIGLAKIDDLDEEFFKDDDIVDR